MSGHIARRVVTAFRQTPPAREAVSTLSPREEEILRLLARGHRSKETADALGIGVGTVNTHVRHTFTRNFTLVRGRKRWRGLWGLE